MLTLFEDPHLKVQARHDRAAGPGARILVSFTGVGHAMGGLQVQKAEFFGAGERFANTVFVTDLTRSWGNRIDFVQLAALLAGLAGQGEIVTIGNSMGAFLAIEVTRHVPVTAALAFAPQFSVSRSVVPWEKRWAKWRARITDFSVPDLAGSFTGQTRYTVLSGGAGPDLRHAHLFPVAPNIHHFVFPRFGHNVARDLKARGALGEVVARGCAGALGVHRLARLAQTPVLQFSPRQNVVQRLASRAQNRALRRKLAR